MNPNINEDLGLWKGNSNRDMVIITYSKQRFCSACYTDTGGVMNETGVWEIFDKIFSRLYM